MATKKISELEAINAAEDNDVLVIVDTSESTTNKITKGNLLIGAGHTIEMTLNENYQIVLVLKNAAGTALSTQTIDLPNENAVTNLAYNNGILTVTKQSGATSQINLTGLIEGLVTESDFNTFKEALQTTLEAINEKDAEQDEAIAENYKVINKLNEKLENQQKVIDQLPQVPGQGTEATLENTIEAQFTKFDVEGNSVQDGTPSPDNEVPIYSAGDNENIFDGETELGSFDNSGQKVASTAVRRNVNPILVKPNSTYILGRNGTELANRVYYYTSNNTFISAETTTGSFTTPNNCNYINFISDRILTDFSNIKLEKGNKASGYSPYGMGSINEKIINKNVLPIDENLIFTRSKTINLDTPIHAGTYVLSLEKWSTTGTGASSLINFIGTSNHSFNINNTTYKSRSITLDEEISQIILYSWYDYGSSGGITATIKGLMLSKNGGTYQPHKEQDYSIFVQQPMRSIGDVRDCFVKKSDGWYERHLPYIASYNGETLPQDVYNEVDNVKYCNEKSMSTTGQFSIGASVQYIDENNWNDLPCTETQIQQLENLPSTYKEMTIINSEDETPAYLEVAGIYDLNKLITRTEVLESEV